MSDAQQLTLQIAGISIGITGTAPGSMDGAYRDFLSQNTPDIHIHLREDTLPESFLKGQSPVFDSEMLWRLYRIDDRWTFVFHSPNPAVLPHRVAQFDEDWRNGEVFIYGSKGDCVTPDLMSYPFFELLMVVLLAQGRGILVHACGIDDGEQGYLFAGNSGHGKTTTARLWQDKARILNDDRIVLRWNEGDGHFWMYGTPWHGEYGRVAAHGRRLNKIFFLQHAATNTVEQQTGTLALSSVLTRSFLPFWDKAGMAFALDFCAQLVASVPCYNLGFVPNEQMMEFVRCVK